MLSTEWLSIVPWVPMEAITLPLFGRVVEPMSNGTWPMMTKLEALHGLRSRGRSPSCYCMRQSTLSHHWSLSPSFGCKAFRFKTAKKTACHLGDRFFEHLDLWFVPRRGDCLKRNKFRKRLAERLRRGGAVGAAMSLEGRPAGFGVEVSLTMFCQSYGGWPANHIDLPQMNCYMFWAKSIRNHQKSIHWIWKIGGKFIKNIGNLEFGPQFWIGHWDHRLSWAGRGCGSWREAPSFKAGGRWGRRWRVQNSSWWCIAGWIAWNDINSLDIYGGSKGCAWNDWKWKRIRHLGGNYQFWRETTFSGRGLLSLPPAPAGWDKRVRMIWWRHD